MGSIKIPKESGLLSLWLATLIYALLEVRGWGYLTALSLVGSVILPLTSDAMLAAIAGRKTRKFLMHFSILLAPYLPLLLLKPALLYLAAPLLPLIAVVHASTSPGREVSHGSTIAGSAAVALHSTALMMSGYVVDPVKLTIPVLYSMMSTSQASLRVLGWNGWAALSGMVAGASLLLSAVPSPFLTLVIASDISSRVIQELGGLSGRMGVKTYGFVELARACLTLTLSALLS